MSKVGYAVRARAGEDETHDLLSPTVGIFTASVERGQLVSEGQLLGTIEVLGVREPLCVPQGVAGRVSWRKAEGSSRVPVQYGDVLLSVGAGSVPAASTAVSKHPQPGQGELCFVAPMSGRYYSRPSPNEPSFVGEGDVVRQGQTIGLLEVMKTFNRLIFSGEDLPERARIERVVPGDGDDVARGDVILVLSSTAER